MDRSSGDSGDRMGRWVTVTLQFRRVLLDAVDDPDEVAYSGVLITHYDSGRKVFESWIPLGGDPSEADDEELIVRLRGALLWQTGRPPDAETSF